MSQGSAEVQGGVNESDCTLPVLTLEVPQRVDKATRRVQDFDNQEGESESESE